MIFAQSIACRPFRACRFSLFPGAALPPPSAALRRSAPGYYSAAFQAGYGSVLRTRRAGPEQQSQASEGKESQEAEAQHI